MNTNETQIPKCLSIASEKDDETGLLLDVWEYPDGRIVKNISDGNFMIGADLTKNPALSIIISD